jgi:hypothetical protein
MRVLLDECVPRKLRSELPGHDVKTVADTKQTVKHHGQTSAADLIVATGSSRRGLDEYQRRARDHHPVAVRKKGRTRFGRGENL